jgi:hypothetical protein
MPQVAPSQALFALISINIRRSIVLWRWRVEQFLMLW